MQNPAGATVPLSVLDVVPLRAGETAGQALHETLALAEHVEKLGYARYWFAEHHGMPGIASSVPSILIGQVAQRTTSIRVGSGGVMLPNHAALSVAEQFGTLEALYPGRIDLGLGRAPGTDPRTASALRGTDVLGADDFSEQLAELMAFFRDDFPEGHPYRHVKAVPGKGHEPPVWLLGSSDYSARLAGVRGLPFAFAHHFSGENTLPALQLYRRAFKPSKALSKPHAMVCVIAIVAATDELARRLALPTALAFLRMRQGRAGTYPTLAEVDAYAWNPAERAFADQWIERAIVGSPASARRQLQRLVDDTEADEVMVLCTAPDAASRRESYTLLREATAA
jgi:luciferase family oxidoreductase group 1